MVSPPSEEHPPRIQQRRDALRRELLTEFVDHHHRRHRRRRTASTLLLLAGVCLALVIATMSPRTDVDPGTDHIATGSDRSMLAPVDQKPRPSIVVQVVSTRHNATDRYIAQAPRLVQRIDDGELLSTLVALNRPAGLARSGDQAWLTRPVTDPINP